MPTTLEKGGFIGADIAVAWKEASSGQARRGEASFVCLHEVSSKTRLSRWLWSYTRPSLCCRKAALAAVNVTGELRILLTIQPVHAFSR